MPFSVLMLLIGIPGSGKTTWVQNYKKTHPLTYVVSTDEIRKELFGRDECDPCYNQKVRDIAKKKVETILNDPNAVGGLGPEIIVDSTNCDVSEWIKYKNLKPSAMIAKVFDVTPEEANKNQQNRERQVPYDAIKKYYSTLQNNKKHLPKIFNLIL